MILYHWETRLQRPFRTKEAKGYCIFLLIKNLSIGNWPRRNSGNRSLTYYFERQDDKKMVPEWLC